MKTTLAFAIGMSIYGGLLVGCSQEVAHSEQDKPHLLDNGHTHEESTTYKNPDGTVSTEHSKSSTSN